MPLTQIKTSNLDSTNGLFFRNRLINGDMRIDQRNNGATVNITTDPQYTLDRWKFGCINANRVSVQRSSQAPAGFSNSILITSLAATALAAGDYYGFQQDIEGFNISDLAFGTASASPVTVSFWIRGSVVGNYSITLRNLAQNRSYCAVYTISLANTWEYKTITIPGDTLGTWVTTNDVGLRVTFALGVGSTFTTAGNTWVGSNNIKASGTVDLVNTNGATLNITGVQIEKGTAATPFEYRPYGTELALCQRYCFAVGDGKRYKGAFTTNVGGNAPNNFEITFPVEMRSGPALSGSYSIAGSFGINDATITRHGMDFSVNRSGFAWDSVGLLQTGNFIFSAEL